MKRNEKILAAALGLMLVGYFAWPTFRSVFIDPVTELEGQADRLATKIADQEQQEFDLLLAGRRLDEARKRGLPGSDLDAQRLYQQWLTDLAQASGLSVQVTPGRRYPVGDVYNGVQVTLEGTATFDELQSFLNRLRRVDLLHRVQRLDVDSPSVEGDPELKLSLTAEGLNFRGAPSRSRLFPQTELAEPLPADAKELTVPRKELAASSGDFLRIGDEFVAVAAVEGDRLRLDRGADGTRAAEHPAGATVELLPVRKPDKDEPPVVLADVDSPFVKPRRYEPHFDGFADAKLVRGESTKMTVRVADYDASAGVPRMELVSGPPGLKFDATTGEMVWEPSADVPSGEHQVTLAATVPNPQKRIEQTATITVVDPNTPPTLDAVAPTEIFLGETLRVPLKATDAESGSLDYKVEQGPEGATIDPATGELRWAVPESFAPGEVTVTVAASDKGEPPLSAKQTFTV
ncbi:MAG TPA: cadherin repeat domain-containing protein, partial [Planctomycetaceae bacterium]